MQHTTTDAKCWQSYELSYYSENKEENKTKQERILPLQRHDFTGHPCRKTCQGPSQLPLPRQLGALYRKRLLSVAERGLGREAAPHSWSGDLRGTQPDYCRSQPPNSFKQCSFIGCLSPFTLQSTLTFCSREAAERPSQSAGQLR